MRNMVRLIAAVVVVGILISGAAYAVSEKAAIVDVGNKICPVSGQAVDGKTFTEYNGKRYGFCCAMCPATFAGDPEKYSAIADKEAAGK